MALINTSCGGGCGAKLKGDAFVRLLSSARELGTIQIADSAVVGLPSSKHVFLSIDVIKPMRLPAAKMAQVLFYHAVNDVVVRGGRPHSIMFFAALTDTSHDRRYLAQMLRALARLAANENCALVGGHTSVDTCGMMGLSVLGCGDSVLGTDTPIQEGDQVVLTKPIGSGIASSTGKKIPPRVIRAMCSYGAKWANHLSLVKMATDVSGSGLVGSLQELGSRTSCDIVLDGPALPFFREIRLGLRLTSDGVISNFNSFRRLFPKKRLKSEVVNLLCDPQTSGASWQLLIHAKACRRLHLIGA